MNHQHTQSPDAASADPAVPLSIIDAAPDPWPGPVTDQTEDAAAPPPESLTRVGWWEGHMPEVVDPLVPRDPETSFTETRHLRHDGWTPEKMRLFHERLAECGVVTEACAAAGMSARSAYNLRDRDPLFAAG